MTVILNEPGSHTVARGLWQWDYGQILRLKGPALPAAVEVHFSLTSVGKEAMVRIGVTRNGVTEVAIPDILLENRGTVVDYTIYAFVYAVDEQAGQTMYRVDLPVKARPKPGKADVAKEKGEEALAQAVAMMNQAAARAEIAEEGAIRMAGNASQSESYARRSAARAAEMAAQAEVAAEETRQAAALGAQITAKVETVEGGAKVTVTDKSGTTTATLTNGKDGKNGAPGKDGYTPVKGVDYFDGEPGATGKSAYQYAKDGGYTGTEAEFAAKLASESAGGGDVNPLRGKKVSFIGDSICAGADSETSYLGGYGRIIADRNGMVYENVGHGGAVITAGTYSKSTGNPLPWLCHMVDDMSADADYAIVEGGLNDGWYTPAITMGSITTGYTADLDETTFYGAFETMLKKLVTKFQGKKIGYIAVPKIHSLYDSEQNAPNFYHVALECCAKWGVPVCDLNTITPPVAYLKTLGTTYTADGTHPTYEGYIKYYCDPIEAWMKTLTTGGNNAATMARKVVEAYTKGINDAIAALKSGKLDNTGISFRKARLPLADGTTLEIDVLTALNGTVVVPFVNRVPISIDTNGEVYDDDGWKAQTRLSASSGSVKDEPYAAITGFMSVKAGDTVRFKYNGAGTCWDTNTLNTGYSIIAYYDSSFTWLGSICPLQDGGNGTPYGICTREDKSTGSVANGGIVSFTVPANTDIAYVRLSFACSTDVKLSDLIVTVNEEIGE